MLLAAARARGKYLPTYFKSMREVASTLSGEQRCRFEKFRGCHIYLGLKIGMKLFKAYTYGGDVSVHKLVILFRRFTGGVGRASQAKQFKATQGELCLDY